jgi:hypothetical protein
VFAVAGVFCLPWLGYTYHVTHHFPYWGNSGGLSLYWMASPNPKDLGEPHTIDEALKNPDLAGHRNFFTHISHIGPVRADEALRRAATKQIKAHPARYAERLVYNFSRLWFRWPFSYQGFNGPKTLFYAIPGALLLAALILGTARLVRRRLAPPGELLPVMLVATLGFGVHVLAAGYPRSISPLVPELILFAVIGLTAGRALSESDETESPPGEERGAEALSGARPVAARPSPCL